MATGIKNYSFKVIEVQPYTSKESTGDAVRVVLRNCTRPQDFNLCYVSEKLCMSTRTLSRRLQNEGLKFHCILNQERKALCEKMMLNGIKDAQYIGRKLGFNDKSHFYKKFTIWFGVSFSEYKKILSQEGTMPRLPE